MREGFDRLSSSLDNNLERPVVLVGYGGVKNAESQSRRMSRHHWAYPIIFTVRPKVSLAGFLSVEEISTTGRQCGENWRNFRTAMIASDPPPLSMGCKRGFQEPFLALRLK